MRSTTSDGLWNESVGEIGATLKALQDRGVTREHMARIRSEPAYADRVAAFMCRGGLESSVHQKLARLVIGDRYFYGMEDWASHDGKRFTKKQLRTIAEFPWSEEILNTPCPFYKGKMVKETHFAFLGIDGLNGAPLTIKRLQELCPASGQPHFRSYPPASWYLSEKFFNEATPRFSWYLVLREAVPNSDMRTFDAQKGMLPSEYEIPSAVVEVAKDILIFRKTGYYPNPMLYARTDDVASDGQRVLVGQCSTHGIEIDRRRGDIGYDLVGVGATRKLPA